MKTGGTLAGGGGIAAAPSDLPAVRVARQAILDPEERLVAYELLFRSADSHAADVVDHVGATSSVIVDGLLDIGLSELVGANLAYLNVSREFLLRVRPLPLPTSRVVLELLEDQDVDEELLEVLRELSGQGFRIALDDFLLGAHTEPLLQFASVVKIDVLEHTDERLQTLVGRVRELAPRAALLAEKVETREAFERCRTLGFELFQGYFFASPSRVQGRRLASQGLSALGSMAELNAAEDFEELNRVITRDLGLSMRLLRYANSAYVSLPRRVGSVQEGLAWLGSMTVRRFALMVALSGVSDAPSELLVTALIRARMCQQLARGGRGADSDSAFTTGLFSVAEALSGAPMQELISELPFRSDIAAALLEGDGELGTLLRGVIAYERGDFDEACGLIGRPVPIEQVYLDAVRWADANLTELG